MTRPSGSNHDFVLSMCLIMTLLVVTQQTIAHALLRFDMPDQSLESALVAFGGLTGYSVLVASNLAEGRQASAVYGDLEPREALQQLLIGTGLTAKYTGTNAFTLVLSSSLPVSEDALADDGTKGRIALDRTSYAAAVQTSITRALCQAQPDAFGRYRVVFQLWMNDNGTVQDVHLLESTGLKERDAVIQNALHGVFMEAPFPVSLPQPITILLTPRPDPAADCRAFIPVAH